MLTDISACQWPPLSSVATVRIVARLKHQAILSAISAKKKKARQYALVPSYLGVLCRDLPGYTPERMLRCLDALLEYHRTQPVKLTIGGDEVLANICGARLYARWSRYVEYIMSKRRAA